MVVAAEHLAVVLRGRELVFRLVDFGLRIFQRLAFLFIGVLAGFRIDLRITGSFVIGARLVQIALRGVDRQVQFIALAGPLKPAVFAQRVVRLRKGFLRRLEIHRVGTLLNLRVFARQIELLLKIEGLDFKVFNLLLQAVGFKFSHHVAGFDLAVFINHPQQLGAVVGLQCQLVLLVGVDVTALHQADHQVVAAHFVGAVLVSAVRRQFLFGGGVGGPLPGNIPAPVSSGGGAQNDQRRHPGGDFFALELHYFACPLVAAAAGAVCVFFSSAGAGFAS